MQGVKNGKRRAISETGSFARRKKHYMPTERNNKGQTNRQRSVYSSSLNNVRF